MDFNDDEKIALGKVMNELMHADGTVHPGERDYLDEMHQQIGIDDDLLAKAEKISMKNALSTIKEMNDEKKEELQVILGELALSDGYFSQEEYTLVFSIFSSVGIDVDP